MIIRASLTQITVLYSCNGQHFFTFRIPETAINIYLQTMICVKLTRITVPAMHYNILVN
jgi:hypothetical protein